MHAAVLLFLFSLRELHPELEHQCLHGSCFRLHHRLNRNLTRREVVYAKAAAEACRIAVARNPTLGVTPTTVSMFWPVYKEHRYDLD